MGSNAAAFSSIGGTVRIASPSERSQIRNEVISMGEKMPTDWHEDTGVVLTIAALDEGPNVLVARDASGAIAGALSFDDNNVKDWGNAVYISFLGTTGITNGAGSALAREATRWAANSDKFVLGSPTEKSTPFWKKMGWHYDPNDTGEDAWGLTAEEAKAAAR